MLSCYLSVTQFTMFDGFFEMFNRLFGVRIRFFFLSGLSMLQGLFRMLNEYIGVTQFAVFHCGRGMLTRLCCMIFLLCITRTCSGQN